MYHQFRNMTVDTSRMQDALEMLIGARDRINSEHGGNYAVAIAVGGDPAAVTLSSPFETLGDYEKMRASVSQDPVVQGMIRMGGGLVTSMQDAITHIVKAPGQRGSFATINTAMMHMPAVTEAVGFAIEVADFVEKKNGNAVGVMTGVTGNRAMLAWVGFTDSLDQIGRDSEALETDPDYLAFFTRSEPLFVPGTLEQSFWQMLP